MMVFGAGGWYGPPAPETAIPMDHRPIMLYQINWTTWVDDRLDKTGTARWTRVVHMRNGGIDNQICNRHRGREGHWQGHCKAPVFRRMVCWRI